MHESLPTLRLPHCEIDLDRALVVQGHTETTLTAREVELLAFLSENPGRTFSLQELLDQVWAYHPDVVSRAVSNAVHRLRRKIELDPKHPEFLVNTYGSGYRLELPVPGSGTASDLPATTGPFLGRADDVERVSALLGDHRIVSICGPGGVGKTRLALEIGRRIPTPAVYVPLSGTVEGSEASGRLARALGVSDQKGALVGELRSRGKVLVLLDAFEEVVGDAQDTVGSWLKSAPQARFLITTRRRLGLTGEAVHDLSGLPAEAARALFLSVARATSARFEGTDDDRRIAQIVERVDRLPLAIEVAAAQSHLLSVDGLLERIKERPLDIGLGGEASVRRALDASWALLPPDEQDHLAVLSVFVGVFTVDEASAVLGLEVEAALGLLADLRNRSMLRNDVPGGEFALYDTVRALAAEKLTGAARDLAERRHAEQGLQGTGDGSQVADNLLAVHRRFLERDPELAARAALALRTKAPHWSVGRRVAILRQITAQADRLPPEMALDVDFQLAHARMVQGHSTEAMGALRSVADRARQAGRRALELEALQALGRAARELSLEQEAIAASTAARDLARELGDRVTEGWATLDLAVIDFHNDRYQASERGYQAAVDLLRGQGAEGLLGRALGRLANTRHHRGLDREALALLDRAEQHLQGADDLTELATIWGYKGNVHIVSGQMQQAVDCYRRALATHERLGEDIWCALWEGCLAVARLEQGAVDDAVRHCENALRRYEQLDNPSNQAMHLLNLSAIQLHRRQLDRSEEAVHRCLALCAELGLPVVECAARVQLGMLWMERGDYKRAERSLAEAARVDSASPTHRRAEIDCWAGLCRLLQNDNAGARERLQRAAEIFEEAPDRNLKQLVDICQVGVDFLEGSLALESVLEEAGSAEIAEVRLASRWVLATLS